MQPIPPPHAHRRGSSIIEVMVVLVVISIGIIGAYSILGSGQKLSETSEARIQAINIAREGLEAIENIRDTNWLRFSSDRIRCWNTLNYDTTCNNVMSGTYLLQKNDNGNWTLSGITTPLSPNSFSIYKETFRVMLDDKGLTTQSGSFSSPCSSSITKMCITPFTREITIIPWWNSLSVKSAVYWVDTSSTKPHNVILETSLTNWKWVLDKGQNP